MTLPDRAEVKRCNRALVAFALLTAARDSALASIKLKHIHLVTISVFKDAREVKTKFSKNFSKFFFSVGAEVRQVFDVWDLHAPRQTLGR